ncbi:MAG: lipid-A-disaccharide synthase [Acidobacteriota bacterium]
MEILISAGEASADRYGAAIMTEIRSRNASVSFSGLGGALMAAGGFEMLANAKDVSVMGFSAVVKRLPVIRRAHAALRQRLSSGRVRVALLIDFPDFNLRLAAFARKAGVKVVYLVAPQTWAWRPGRVKILPGLVDRMLCILPFEEMELRSAGVDTVFVGHPMRDLAVPTASQDRLRQQHRLPADASLVGLVPGSRVHVMERLLPTMVAAGHLLQKERPDVQFLIPVAGTLDRAKVQQCASSLGDQVHVRSGCFTDLMSCCSVAVSASGTATLELALLGVPTVIVYRVGGLLSWLARRFLRVRHVGLPNLVAGRKLLPERLQDGFRADAVANDLNYWLSEDKERQVLSDELRALRNLLGPPGVLGRVADQVLEVAA